MGLDIFEVNAKFLQWIKRPYRTWLPVLCESPYRLSSLLSPHQTFQPTWLSLPTPARSYLNPPGIPFSQVTHMSTPLPLSNHRSRATFSTRLTLPTVLKIPSYMPPDSHSSDSLHCFPLPFSIALTLHKIYLFNMLSLLTNSAP